ncbi:glycine dehydrogenase (aminomethyl-transferring), partial [Nocardia nova]|nr:glycine dehydrogenase (aminomethyl-transferring) [Nocardia nova]
MTRSFADRHIGPDPTELDRILDTVGVGSMDELAARAVPASILDAAGETGLDALPAAVSEHDALTELAALAHSNTVATSMIGLGYYDTLTPPVLVRNLLENPAWYTAYTPYQPEISQGRLEALLNFQTMVSDLTGMEVANASMLDEATAAAEAMTLLQRANRKSTSQRLLIDADLFPQTRTVLTTRAEPLGITLVEADLSSGELPEGDFFGVVLQTPGASGRIADPTAVIAAAHARGALVAVG